jgi:hypothetical protein
MKILLLTIIISFVQFAFSQSKKELIEQLTFQIDSLNAVIKKQNDNIFQLQTERNQLVEDKSLIEKQKASAENDNASLKNILNERDSTIKSLNTTLQNKEKETYVLKDSLQLLYSNNAVLPILKSATYAGKYSFEYDNGAAGSLQMYFDGKEDYYFYLDYVKGSPSYNMGTLEGIMKIYGNIGVFNASLYDSDVCKIIFLFDENGVFIKQYTDDLSCGFGNNVFISEYYIKDNDENRQIQPSENSSGTYINSTNKW